MVVKQRANHYATPSYSVKRRAHSHMKKPEEGAQPYEETTGGMAAMAELAGRR
jgi:hypothetical protein